MNIEQLNEKFSLAGQLRWQHGENDFPIAHIENEHANATISLYGGQLLTWRPHSSDPVLWLSELAMYQQGKAIRGGVPIIFPWFGGHPTDSSKPSHGVARTAMWRVVRVASNADGDTVVQMSLRDDKQTRQVWAHAFRLDVVYVIGRTLTTTVTAFNTGSEPFTMGGALHTYFTVGSTPVVAVDGLEGAQFDDKVNGGWHTQEYAVKFEEEVDRVYVSAETTSIYDPTLQRRIIIGKRNSNTTVVWNPGMTAKKSDLTEDAWAQFICIEAAKHGDDLVVVRPNQHFALSQTVSVDSV